MPKLLLWNVQFAKHTASIKHVENLLAEESIEIACLTESTTDYFSSQQNIVRATGDYGYSDHKGKRQKVTLWSREPWSDVNYIGNSGMPAGRFLSGVSQGVRFVGVCIPWSMAHVSSGHKNRKPWEDHKTYLAGLAKVIEEYLESPIPLCVLGDFNQRIPTTNYYAGVYDLLMKALGSHMQVQTASIAGDEKPLIDHIATCSRLRFEQEALIEKSDRLGELLSDHAGVIGELQFT